MIILQNCQQVNKKKKKNVYTFCLVFEKIEEIQETIELYHCLIFMDLSKNMF
jgi:hypothetical protein